MHYGFLFLFFFLSLICSQLCSSLYFVSLSVLVFSLFYNAVENLCKTEVSNYIRIVRVGIEYSAAIRLRLCFRFHINALLHMTSCCSSGRHLVVCCAAAAFACGRIKHLSVSLRLLIVTLVGCVEVLELPLQCLERGSAHRVLVPTLQHYLIKALLTVRWHGHAIAVFHLG